MFAIVIMLGVVPCTGMVVVVVVVVVMAVEGVEGMVVVVVFSICFFSTSRNVRFILHSAPTSVQSPFF